MNLKKIKLTKKKIIIIVVACLVIPVLALTSYVSYLMFFSPNPTFVSSGDSSEQTSQLGLPTAEESGIENIVLFGVDSRTPNDHGRTDSIMIATVDKKNKAIKLSSIMRDLYVDIGDNDKQMNRINAAYAYGGPEKAIDVLNKNFGMDLKYYAIVDFKGFQEVVDKLGGIDVEVKDYEVNEINHYIKEVNGSNSKLLTHSGYQHLNGQQALSFSRIRKVGNGDYERTERQRLVLKCLMDKAKQVDAVKVSQLFTSLLSYVQTNMPVQKAMDLGMTALKCNGSFQTMRIPVDGYFEPQYVSGLAVLVPDIKANAQLLKEFIYNMKVTADEDVPVYMQNNFHMDDVAVSNDKPKANIPDYNTHDVPVKSDDEQSADEMLPSKGKTDGNATDIKNGTKPGTGSDAKNSGDTGNNSGNDNGGGSGSHTATP